MNKYFKIAFIILFFVSVLGITESKSQEKVEISLGAGMWELLHVGVHYNLNNKLQAGVKIGTDPMYSLGYVLTVTGDFNYYYGGKSRFSNQAPWYINSGINYFHEDSETFIGKSIFLNIRHGRTFNFSNRFGLKLETGLAIGLLYTKNHRDPDYYYRDKDYDEDDLPKFPTLTLKIFYRI